jgi:tetratricopeptide (TPR) repeat protein
MRGDHWHFQTAPDLAHLLRREREDVRRLSRAATEALAIRLAVEGENSPSVTDNRNALAAIAYVSGDLKGAEAIYRANLVNDERVLGARHPDLGITLNNLARMLIDQRRFAEAVPLLDEARDTLKPAELAELNKAFADRFGSDE